MTRRRDLRDGMIIGAMFGVFASAIYVVLWWAIDSLLERVSPAEVLGWSAIACGVVAGGLSVVGGER